MTNRAGAARDWNPGGVQARLINEFQRNLPLSSRPFRDIAGQLGWSETGVVAALTDLIQDGVVSRVGPVIRPNTVGASALAAMTVPPHRLAAVAALVTARPEVNHNYEREHRFNLWFVITAATAAQLDAAVGNIETGAGLGVMVLPMLDDYYIDLGFDLNGGDKPGHQQPGMDARALDIDDVDRRLLQAIQDGLPLTERPYESVGMTLGLPEWMVVERLRRLLGAGVVKRLGVIVRHHECGYRHNAMVVWDVPDHAVHRAGRRLAAENVVRLCYRRPRRPPDWPYNLFCMIHGKDREDVLAEVGDVACRTGLDSFPRDVLFSARRFKQRGARYDFNDATAPPPLGARP